MTDPSEFQAGARWARGVLGKGGTPTKVERKQDARVIQATTRAEIEVEVDQAFAEVRDNADRRAGREAAMRLLATKHLAQGRAVPSITPAAISAPRTRAVSDADMAELRRQVAADVDAAMSKPAAPSVSSAAPQRTDVSRTRTGELPKQYRAGQIVQQKR